MVVLVKTIESNEIEKKANYNTSQRPYWKMIGIKFKLRKREFLVS